MNILLGDALRNASVDNPQAGAAEANKTIGLLLCYLSASSCQLRDARLRSYSPSGFGHFVRDLRLVA